MTREQSIEYASAKQTLKPFGIPLMSAVSTVAKAVKLVGDLSNVIAAAKFFTARNRTVTAKRVADAVAELIAIKESRGASLPYIQTLRSRLNRFAAAFQKGMGNVTTANIQAWLDSEKFQPVNYDGFRLGLNLLFKFGIARGYCIDNPVEQIERVKATAGETEIYTPQEIGKLLAAASPEFLPCLAIGAFAGLRSAEIERLEWSDIDFRSKHITVGAKKSKTASRRVVPIQDNLAAWLARCGEQKGMVWRGTHDRFHDAQQKTADAARPEMETERAAPLLRKLPARQDAERGASRARMRQQPAGDFRPLPRACEASGGVAVVRHAARRRGRAGRDEGCPRCH